jgi:hypothetical protein
MLISYSLLRLGSDFHELVPRADKTKIKYRENRVRPYELEQVDMLKCLRALETTRVLIKTRRVISNESDKKLGFMYNVIVPFSLHTACIWCILIDLHTVGARGSSVSVPFDYKLDLRRSIPCRCKGLFL